MSSTSSDAFPVVVIGAGLAGLTAALHLAARGVPPLVLEADSRWPGGRLSGGDPDVFEYAGRTWAFRPDHGVHALWGNYYNMRALFDRFLNVELQPSIGEEWINRWGRDVRRIEAGNAVRSRWLPAPFHYLQLLFHPYIWHNITPLDFLSLPGFLVSILWAVGFDPVRERKALDGLMMNEFFRGWTPNLRATFTGLGENLLAAPAGSISLTAFIAALRFFTMLRRDSWRLDYLTGNTHDALIQPLIDRIQEMDGMVMYGATALRLERLGCNWKVSVEDTRAGGPRSLIAENVVLAVEAPAAQRLLAASPQTAQAAARLIFPDALPNVAIRLWFGASPGEGAPGGMFTGDFVPNNFFWLHRLYNEFGEWHEVTGGSALEVHIYGPQSILDQPDPNLVILATSEVQRAFPALKGSYVHGTIRRNVRTQTLFRVPTEDSLYVETPWPGIAACGDWIGYPSPSMWMERAVITGIAAANRVLSARGLEPFHIVEPRPPELFVRVLEAIIHLFRRILGPGIAAVIRTLRRMRLGS